MTFLDVVLRGLVRRPLRTGLTALGISLGIAALVALVGTARGFQRGWADAMKARGTDIVVSNMAGALTPTTFDQSERNRIARLPGIKSTSILLVNLTSVEDAPMVVVSGREWGGYEWRNLKLVSGRLPRDASEPAVVLGKAAADTLHKKVGDPIQIEAQQLQVAGIADGGALVENGSIILSLPLLQQIMGDSGKINVIDVQVDPSLDDSAIKRLCSEIDRQIPEAHAMEAANHIGDSMAYRLIHAMSWGTSLLAVLVGVLGVTNTMLMSVFERTREIGILLAIGWRRVRIIQLILWESALLGLTGGLVGILLGYAAARAIEVAPAMRGLVQADFNPGLFAIAVAIAVCVGVLSGAYPAWRGAQAEPGRSLAA